MKRSAQKRGGGQTEVTLFEDDAVTEDAMDELLSLNEALKKLAVGLEIPIPQLFTAPRKGQVNGRMAVTKAGEGGEHPTATYEHELLASALTKKAMLPYRARVRARVRARKAGKTADHADGAD